MAHMNEYTKDTLYVVGGALLGVGVALLFGTQKGKEIRKTMARFARTFGSRTDEVIRQFADDVADFTDTLGEKVAGILHSGMEVTDQAKREMLSAIETGQKKLEKQRHRLSKMVG